MIDPEKLEAVLFDLDGTLVDTDDIAVDNLARRLGPFRRLLPNRDPVPLARWLTMQAETPGNALITALDIVHLDSLILGVSEFMRSRHHDGSHDSFRPLEQTGDLLQQLNGRYRLALVTTRGRRDIEAFRGRHPELASHLEHFIGRQDSRRLKPHPEPVLAAAARLQVPVERCLMVGDTTMDVLAARRAGAWSVGVLCGFGERAELERAGAHLILDHTAELRELL